MTERHHYKYVVLDSSKENGNAVQAKFNVQIPHGITNASRVCVKSFSMPNVIHNVYGDFKTVRFVEFYRPTAGGWPRWSLICTSKWLMSFLVKTFHMGVSVWYVRYEYLGTSLLINWSTSLWCATITLSEWARPTIVSLPSSVEAM